VVPATPCASRSTVASMTLASWASALVRTPSSGSVQFRIEPPRGDSPSAFAPGKTYVELRLAQMHLRDRRVLWRDFLPLGTVTTEFQFGGGRRMMPFVVGPDLLANAPNHTSGDLVEFFDTRVSGPFPYVGDDVVVFASLARLETENWARRALGLLGSVASIFDVSRLSTYVDVAGGLTSALQGLLGMQEVEQLVGVQRSFTTPSEDPGAARGPRALRPGYELFMNADPGDFGEERRRTFAMQDGRLHEAGRPFTGADFMVLEAISVPRRADYATFPFHREHWRKAESHVMEGRPDAAWRRFEMLASELVSSDDLVYAHREALLEEYADRLKDLIARREAIFDRGGTHGFDSAAVEEVGEAHLEAAVASRTHEHTRAPEQLLADVMRGPGLR
jgi:hypothetical protein